MKNKLFETIKTIRTNKSCKNQAKYLNNSCKQFETALKQIVKLQKNHHQKQCKQQ